VKGGEISKVQEQETGHLGELYIWQELGTMLLLAGASPPWISSEWSFRNATAGPPSTSNSSTRP
jgi:hypothetical protein